MPSRLPRSTPQQQHVDPAGIMSLVQALEDQRLETHSLMVVRNGDVIAETWWAPYEETGIHLLYSLTKSFTSTAVGFAVAEGKLGLDDLLVDHFPELVDPNASPNLKKVRVRHLLAMAVGHEKEPWMSFDQTWADYVRGFLAHPVPREPGEHFVYNTAASNVLSILVQISTGESLGHYLQTRLLEPLGVTNVEWTQGGDFDLGGTGLFADTETIAKLGLLYLQGGVWEGEQVLPKDWAELASSTQVANGTDANNDWNQGYGFQFWRCRHGAFRGDGAFGQFCIVLPDKQAVVAITSGDGDMQAILNAVWTHLLPAFDRSATPGVSAPEKVRRLEPSFASATGPSSVRFKNEAEAFELTLSDGSGTLNWQDSIPIRLDEWVEGNFTTSHIPQRRCAARATWVTSDELLIKLVDLHRPQRLSVRVRLEGAQAKVRIEEYGNFGSPEPKEFFAHPAS